MWRNFYSLNRPNQMGATEFPDLTDLAVPLLAQEQAEDGIAAQLQDVNVTFAEEPGWETEYLIDLTPSFEINDPRVPTAIGSIIEMPVPYTMEEIMNMEVVLWEDLFPNVSEDAEQTDQMVDEPDPDEAL